jgi:hypothetical protein
MKYNFEESKREYEAKYPGRMEVAQIKDMLKSLTSEQRLEAFEHYCKLCGDASPDSSGHYCQCGNDE